jgi:hypothetical protein
LCCSPHRERRCAQDGRHCRRRVLCSCCDSKRSVLHHARLLSLAGSDLYFSVRAVFSLSQLPLTCPLGLVLPILPLLVAARVRVLLIVRAILLVAVNPRILQTPIEGTGTLLREIEHGSITSETGPRTIMDAAVGVAVRLPQMTVSLLFLVSWNTSPIAL